MLGLPKNTEMNHPLPKKAIFDKFKPNAADRQRFDAEIRRLSVIYEVSAVTTNIAAGENAAAFYVVLVTLRSAECDKKNLAMLSKLIEQNMLFVLEHDGKARLAAYRAGRVIQSGWKLLDEWTINLIGLNLDSVWDNIIVQIGGITIAEGNTLDEQIVADEECKKLLRRVEQLEKQARTEKQPRRKWELAEASAKLRKKLEK
ncbi:MAG: DUF4391 domain-containing protein [Synergistaceae bacterium]|jgi:hypothetical protein|nr:DUF4391 domain-containing protein [Synergistaceae bacterium]